MAAAEIRGRPHGRHGAAASLTAAVAPGSTMKVIVSAAALASGRYNPQSVVPAGPSYTPVKGGGFTISNLGMFGVKEFAAIINPPQAMILAVGVGEERVVARKGEMVIRTMMSCTLAVDHRVVDGAMGAQFLQTLRTYIEQPAAMLV